MRELRRGYKQTEVGVIPEDWEVSSLREIVRSGPKNGYSGPTGEALSGTPTLSLAATSSGRMILNETTVKHLEQTIPASSPLFLEAGDVLVQRANTADLVGTTAVFNGPSATYIYPDLMMRLRFGRRSTGEWFWRHANSGKGRAFFRSAAAGSTGTMPKISGEALRNMPVPMAPPSEEAAVVGALSDADALIESLEQFLTKKRQIKQGAMQELLTGKRRLAGFTARWKTIPLGDTGAWLSGGTPAMSVAEYWNGEIPWVSPKDMKVKRVHDAIDHVSKSALSAGTRLVQAGTILMVVRGMILAHSFPVARVERPVAFNQDIKALEVRPGVDSNFLLWWLTANESLVLSLTNESTHGTKRMPTEVLFALQVALPEESEQTAIATVLSDMDAEIAALETKLTKARQLKQGMMQALLTGNIRLV